MCFCLLTVISAAADELEIPSNSGSEYGWMCRTNRVRSRTGQDYKGDYQFVLPNDTPSGVPSPEIRGAGRDCENAAIVSCTPLGQAYELTLYSNRPAGRLALLHVTGTATGHAGLWLANAGVSGQATTVDGAPCLALGFVDLGFADLASAAAVGANMANGWLAELAIRRKRAVTRL